MEEMRNVGRGPGRDALEPLAGAAHDFYIHGFPVLEMARARLRTMGASSNAFIHVRRLSDASSRLVTTPNNDTLYSSAWLDMSLGPVEIELPETGGRYVSLAVLDLYTNNFIVTGSAAGEARQRIRILPPGSLAGAGEVVAPTWWVWAQVRTLVAGSGDLAGARALQNGIVLHAPAGRGPAPAAQADGDAYREVLAIAALLRTEAPPSVQARPLLAAIADAGLTATRLEAGDAAIREAVAVGVASARAAIAARLADDNAVHGWIYQAASLGDFGTDYLYRASIAHWGLGALPVHEAMYMRGVTQGGARSFNGEAVHVLRFGPGQTPPVRAFWSLSLYEVDADGRLYFTANTPGRYAIGDRTPDLVAMADGGLEIWMSVSPPPAGRRTNWLPAPAGPFALVLRAYLPEPALRDGRYRLPPVIAIDPSTGAPMP
ncbi:MAG: DUF1254 domain-containing protein [Alphaproteobacteria bacterium]